MSALPETALPELVELTQLGPNDLDPLLAAEIDVWKRRFCWDFRPSADLLRRFLQLRALYGYALRLHGEFIGYSYYVCEARKGLIGDFFVRDEYAGVAQELHLLRAVVSALVQTPGLRRIESQLMLIRTPPGAAAFPLHSHLLRHDRFYMEANHAAIRALPITVPTFRVRFVRWEDRFMEDMAHLLSAAYRGHVDSEINDQYRNIPGARQFLNNIVRYPGCGRFAPEASLLALDASTGRVCGMCLASHVSDKAGHITQVCVLPALRGVHLGYEMVRQTALRLFEGGTQSVSLTVTCANMDAVRLYQSMGYVIQASFPALVWEGF